MRFSRSTHLLFLSLETLTSITRTGLPILVELIDLVNSVIISNDLTQMVNFPTRIPDCDSHSPALLDLFISSDASICSTMAFPPLGNFDHVVVSVSIKFTTGCPVSSHSLWLFSCWLGWSYDHLRDVPWEDIFKDALSGLRQFLANESSLNMMKNAFYFTLKALFVLKLFKVM